MKARWAAYLIGLLAGLAMGALSQRALDEREYLERSKVIVRETQRAHDRCDEAFLGIAEAVLEYRGGR